MEYEILMGILKPMRMSTKSVSMFGGDLSCQEVGCKGIEPEYDSMVVLELEGHAEVDLNTPYQQLRLLQEESPRADHRASAPCELGRVEAHCPCRLSRTTWMTCR